MSLVVCRDNQGRCRVEVAFPPITKLYSCLGIRILNGGIFTSGYVLYINRTYSRSVFVYISE